ncbi:MAG TPA: hypothetical protein VEW48_26995 [Thermoanaerobaculia bacterium]|nr:hypothetical protein [Thermoanaerobaculia bacterium]
METIHRTIETIHEYAVRFQGEDGTLYAILACGELRDDGMWEGCLEFRPLAGGLPRRTRRETTQPSRDALVYWASGLEPIYFEGAFTRAG